MSEIEAGGCAPPVIVEDEVTPETVQRQRALLAEEVKQHVSPATLRRHNKRRQLPQRTVDDVAERVVKRIGKLERRALQARKAGLLPEVEA
jgi:hypothetical protein